MICYRDMTFCESDCTNITCWRYISPAVMQGAERTGLPLAVCDFSENCESYQPTRFQKKSANSI